MMASMLLAPKQNKAGTKRFQKFQWKGAASISCVLFIPVFIAPFFPE